MKRVLLGILFGLVGATFACAQKGNDMKKSAPPTPKITREYLLAHGFKPVKDRPDVFTARDTRLGDIAGTIGFHPSDLQLAPSVQRPYEILTVETRGVYVIVRPEFRDSKGRPVLEPLDNPDVLCKVRILIQHPQREYLKTDSSPRMRIKSVVVPEDHSKPLQVDFELSATGHKPVAILQHNFHVYVTGGSISQQTGLGYSFHATTPRKIIVSPDQPTIIRLRVYLDLVGHLSPGEYTLRIRIGESKRREPQRFDYEWEGREHWSNDYKFVVKRPASK